MKHGLVFCRYINLYPTSRLTFLSNIVVGKTKALFANWCWKEWGRLLSYVFKFHSTPLYVLLTAYCHYCSRHISQVIDPHSAEGPCRHILLALCGFGYSFLSWNKVNKSLLRRISLVKASFIWYCFPPAPPVRACAQDYFIFNLFTCNL
jgi:hypothetical protein